MKHIESRAETIRVVGLRVVVGRVSVFEMELRNKHRRVVRVPRGTRTLSLRCFGGPVRLLNADEGSCFVDSSPPARVWLVRETTRTTTVIVAFRR